jgi:hypothetical protein
MSYDRKIRLRGRPWYQVARRVPLGYELDPAENRGFSLLIPAYLVVEDAVNPVGEPWLAGDDPAFVYQRPHESPRECSTGL